MNKKLLVCFIFFSQSVLAQEYSYIWANQYPALADPATVCCYDFDGDMVEDNQNGAVMASLESLLGEDLQILTDDLIINNQYVRVWRWDQLPAANGPVTMNILTAEVTNPAINLQDRIDGLTQVLIDPTSTSQFTGTMTNGEIDLFANSSETLFYVPLIIGGIGSRQMGGGGTFALLPLNEARIRGTITQDVGGCQGVCGETSVGTDPALLGDMEISGLIHHADEIDALNDIASQCTCAGVDPNIPLLSYVEDDQSLTFSCNYTDLDQTMCDGSIPFCQNVESPCDFAGILSSFYDQDTNNNGVNDSKSVGGLLGVSGTTVSGIQDLIFADNFE